MPSRFSKSISVAALTFLALAVSNCTVKLRAELARVSNNQNAAPLGPPAAVVITSGNSQTGAVNSPLGTWFQVLVQDSSGNALPDVLVTWTTTNGNGTLSTTTSSTDSNGHAKALLTLGSSVGANTVTAAVSSLNPVAFTAIGVSLGAASPVYPTNGANWNDYVEWSSQVAGKTILNQTDSACLGTENGYYKCIHGGELRKFVLQGETSCTGLSGSDSLGAFNWICDSSSGTATFYSTGLQTSKGLRDLVTATGWKNNQFIVTQNGEPLVSSTPAAWWTNTVTALTPNPTSSSAPVALSGASTIYVQATSTTTSGYALGSTNKLAIVTLPGATLTYSGYATNWCTNSGGIGAGTFTSVLCMGASKFTWIEASLSGSAQTINLSGSSFSKIYRTQITGCTTQCLTETNTAKSNYFGNSKITSNSTSAYATYIGGTYSLALNDTITNSATGFFQNGANGVVYNLIASNNQTGFEAYFGSSGSFVGITAFNSNSNNMLLWAGQTNQSYLNMTLSSGVGGIYYGSTGHLNNNFSNLVIDNTATGINMSGSTGDIYTDVVVRDNNAYGISVGATPSPSPTTSSNVFNGLLGIGGNAIDCAVHTGSSNNGLTNTCFHGPSNAEAPTPIPNLSSSFIGPITMNDTVNTTTQTTGSALFGNIGDWLNFENPFRGWGKSGTFLNVTSEQSCGSAHTCQIYDYSLNVADTILRNYYGAFSNNAPCPASVDATNTANIITDGLGRVYLKNAVEVMDPYNNPSGNFDGLCETGETCIYSPNLGSYQGEGDYTTQECTFNPGNGLTGIKMYAYPTNGRTVGE